MPSVTAALLGLVDASRVALAPSRSDANCLLDVLPTSANGHAAGTRKKSRDG